MQRLPQILVHFDLRRRFMHITDLHTINMIKQYGDNGFGSCLVMFKDVKFEIKWTLQSPVLKKQIVNGRVL